MQDSQPHGLVQRLSSALTGKQRRHLRSLAHSLNPVVIIGQGGVSDGVVGSVDQALSTHELVKVKVLGSHLEPLPTVAEQLAQRTSSALVQKIGRMLVLYRRNEEDPRIELGAAD